MKRSDLLPAALIAALIALMALTYFAHPAYAQEPESCTVQSFDPPIGPVFAMPGDADRVTITLVDGTTTTLIGPFSLGDVVDAGGPVIRLEKCSGVGTPPATPTPAPEPPTPTPTADPTVTATPIPEDQCCTTIVTPGPTATPTPIIPEPPATPTPEYPEPTPIMTLTSATPTPAVPTLPNTGTTTGPLVVAGLFAIFAGLMLLGSLRR